MRGVEEVLVRRNSGVILGSGDTWLLLLGESEYWRLVMGLRYMHAWIWFFGERQYKGMGFVIV